MISAQKSLLFSLVICSIADIDGLESSAKKVVINVETLPEPFTDEKLPGSDSKSKNQKACYSLMGCYQVPPIHAMHLSPLNLKTSFKIIHKEVESIIRVETCDTCLASKPDECDRYPFDLEKILNSPYQIDKRTVVITGGYRSKANSTWDINMRRFWSKLDDLNIIAVDWTSSNDGLYPNAAANTRPIARQLTVLMYYLAKLKGGPEMDLYNDAFIDKFYLIGHSLGTHLFGFVGRDLAGRVGRITGLDPAGPLFDTLTTEFRIDPSDARFVDILHTNAGSNIVSFKAQFGSAISSGHIDLWANNGRNQPGCSNELSGCSHKRATKLFGLFLNDVLSMREYLGDKYKPLYRLRAYRSDSYEGFHDGSSLARRCPTASVDDNDLSYADLAHCSIPIDFLSWYSDYKMELETLHGLHFNESVTTRAPNNFFFYTNREAASVVDHYLIKIRVTKFAGSGKEQEKKEDKFKVADGCAIGVDIEMANGLDDSHQLDNYHLMDLGDHYEVLVPFLASNSIPKHEIAKLDSQDFFVEPSKSAEKEVIDPENLKSLREALEQIFPTSVILRGFQGRQDSESGDVAAETGKQKKRSIFDSIKSFFRGDSSKQADEAAPVGKPRGLDCHLPAESFIIQPLRKFRRHLSAFYVRDCSNNENPKPEVRIILLGGNETSPKTQLFVEAAAESGCTPDMADESMKLELRTLIIGPLLTIEREEMQGWNNLQSNLDEMDSDTSATDAHGRRATETKLWLTLSISLSIVLVALMLIAIPIIKRTKTDKVLSKQTVLMINTNRVALAPGN